MNNAQSFGSEDSPTGTPIPRPLETFPADEWDFTNVIMPVVTTDAMKQFFEFGGPGAYGEFVAQVPMRRFGDAKLDADGLVAFLGGPTARYITGKTFELDGGSLLHA